MRTTILRFVRKHILFIALVLRAEGYQIKITQVSLRVTYIYTFSELYMCKRFVIRFKSLNNVTAENYLWNLYRKCILAHTCTFEIYQKDLSCSVFKLFLSFLECSLWIIGIFWTLFLFLMSNRIKLSQKQNKSCPPFKSILWCNISLEWCTQLFNFIHKLIN